MTNKRWMMWGGAGLLVVALAGVGLAMAHGGASAGVGASAWGFGPRGGHAAADNVSYEKTDNGYANVQVTRGNSTLLLKSVESPTPDAIRLQGRGAGIEARSENGTTVTFVFPEGATLVTHDAVESWSPAGATVTYASGEVANLVLGKNATLAQDGQTLTVTLPAQGGMHFGLLPPEGAPCPHGGPMMGGPREGGFGGPRGHGPGHR